jgi:hypothetical protein
MKFERGRPRKGQKGEWDSKTKMKFGTLLACGFVLLLGWLFARFLIGSF